MACLANRRGGRVTTIGTVCASCGTAPSRVGARFCDACGSPIDATPAAEFKQVTVLFADVVHSMDIAAAVGVDMAWAEAMN